MARKDDPRIDLPARLAASPATDALRDAGDRNVVLHPMVIYQSFLDDLSAINMAGDFDAWADTTEYPYSVHTDEIDKVIECPEESRPFFQMVCDMIVELGIDDFVRVAEHAEFLDPSMIVGHHIGYLRKAGVDVVKPVTSRMVIRRTTGRWRMISVTNGVANDQYPYHRPEPSDGILPEANIRDRQAARSLAQAQARGRGATSARAVYDAFLEAFTAANNSGDFDTWNAMHLARVRKHLPTEDYTIDTRIERRGIFDAIAAEVTACGADHHERVSQFAEWVGPNRIRGKHQSIMRKNGRPVRPPVDSQFILERGGDGVWRLADVTNSMDLHSQIDLVEALSNLHLPERRNR